MGEDVLKGLFTVAAAIIGVAIIATLVSNNAGTANIITSAGKALGTDISAATAPVTGASGGLGGLGGINPISTLTNMGI